jgi:hypothetical protein
VPAGQLSSGVWPNDCATPATDAKITSKKIMARMEKTLMTFQLKPYRSKFDKSVPASKMGCSRIVYNLTKTPVELYDCYENRNEDALTGYFCRTHRCFVAGALTFANLTCPNVAPLLTIDRPAKQACDSKGTSADRVEVG